MADVNKNTSVTLVPVITYVAAATKTAAIIIFEGIIDGWRMEEGRLDISISNILSQWAQHTLSKHSSSCRWKEFKGTECAYAGEETWCDRSYTRCGALSNTDNFGGFRWLPSIVDTEIWWGKVQETR